MTTRDPQDRRPGTGPATDRPEAERSTAPSHTDESPLPPALARRLVRLGEREIARARLLPRALRPLPSWRSRAGWLLAIAATLAWLAVPSPFRHAAGARTARDGDAATGSTTTALLRDPAALHVPWAPSTDPAARTASGEVVWDAAHQRGVLRIRGLVPNDPAAAQYQLWIIDADRDARYPVDGGVFDVTTDGEVLVPVAARLRVGHPSLFAITLERPGGVVVSGRERLVLAAPVPG